MPFMQEAQLDNERYKEELKVFQSRKQSQSGDSEVKEKSSKKKSKKSFDGASGAKEVEAAATAAKKEENPAISFIGNNCELPIFTDSFLEHNKNVESELKMLRKNNMEMEQQNDVLMKHIENMENGVRKVEGEISETKQRNVQLEMYLTKMKIILASGFNSFTSPTMKTVPSVENIEQFVNDLSAEAMIHKSPTTVNKAREILKKIDLKL
jgi:high mobility group protein 20A